MKKRLNWIREYHGLTQQQIADATGYSRETVSRFENGHSANFGLQLYYERLEEEIYKRQGVK